MQKKNLSKVFTVAGLHEDGYLLFLEICKKYEKGRVKRTESDIQGLERKASIQAIVCEMSVWS